MSRGRHEVGPASCPADAVIVGAGVAPDVSLAQKAGLEIGERGGVLTDSRLRTSAPDVFAAGDIAEYESVVHDGQRIRIEHWDVAETQGKAAALSMLGRDEPYDTVPYFFSDLSDWTWMEYVGPGVRLERGDRARLDRGLRVHDLVPRRRPAGGGAQPSTAPTTSSARAS